MISPLPLRAVTVVAVFHLLATSAFAQHDPGVRGGIENTAGQLQFRAIPIPHPPAIGPNPATGAEIGPNELISFVEGINRAGQLESTCDDCADVTDGSPVVGLGELDPVFPQFHTNSNGLGARHNADQCFLCHAQPTLGGSGGFLVPNPGDARPCRRRIRMFRLVPFRFGKQNVVPSFEQQFGPIREVRFKYHPDGTRDGGVHQLWTVTRHHQRSDHSRIATSFSPTSPPSWQGQSVVPHSDADVRDRSDDSIQDREILAAS